MAHKKRMSKRVSTRKREKINKKVKEHYRKKKREQKEKKGVPRSVLMTTEHKAHLKKIKEDTEARTQAYYEAENMSNL